MSRPSPSGAERTARATARQAAPTLVDTPDAAHSHIKVKTKSSGGATPVAVASSDATVADAVSAQPPPVDAAAVDSAAVIASVAYCKGCRAHEVALDDISATLGQEDGLVWVGLRAPSPELLTRVGESLSLGPKAVEEILAPHRRPKVIDFGHAVLVVAITVEIDNQRAVYGETQLVIGDGFLLTVRRGAAANYTSLRERLEAAPDMLARGSDFVASELLDAIVDRYVVAAEKLEHLVEQAEQKLLIRGQKDADVRRIYKQRRDLLRIHTAVAPLAEICRRLSRVDTSRIDMLARPYFAEVADRVLRVDELLNSLREALAFAFEASLMIGQSQQNDTTRKLAAWAAILAVPTAIAGIYGMNFKHMPELDSIYGYPLTLSIIGVACSVLYWRFRSTGWL